MTLRMVFSRDVTSWRWVCVFLAISCLTACGSVSKLQRTEATKSKSLADFDVVYVADFKDATTPKIDDANKRAAYDETLRKAALAFSDLIAQNIGKTKNPPTVVRKPSETGGVLRIEGEITVFDSGLAIARILPLVGGSEFNANVRFVDGTSNELLGEMIVDKNSNPIGGWYAITQTANRFMGGAAGKVADQLHKARNRERGSD